MILFNATTVSLRWEHNFRACAGDYIDEKTLEEEYNGIVPAFYLEDTGSFMRIYCFFYTGVFGIIIIIGCLITLWVTYKTTYGGARLAHDPEYEPAY